MPPPSRLHRHRLPRVASLLATFAILSPALSAAAPLRVSLGSGANDSAPYATDRTLASLARYLASDHAMNCTVLTWDPATAGFRDIDRLLDADVAIFFVRRKPPNPHNLAVLQNFFSSGKGFIALRSTSHAWENWPDFDTEILGAKYGGPQGGNIGDAEKLLFRPHPVWAGGESFTTRCDLYRYGPMAADVTVILEGETPRHHACRVDARPSRRATVSPRARLCLRRGETGVSPHRRQRFKLGQRAHRKIVQTPPSKFGRTPRAECKTKR